MDRVRRRRPQALITPGPTPTGRRMPPVGLAGPSPPRRPRRPSLRSSDEHVPPVPTLVIGAPTRADGAQTERIDCRPRHVCMCGWCRRGRWRRTGLSRSRGDRVQVAVVGGTRAAGEPAGRHDPQSWRQLVNDQGQLRTQDMHQSSNICPKRPARLGRASARTDSTTGRMRDIRVGAGAHDRPPPRRPVKGACGVADAMATPPWTVRPDPWKRWLSGGSHGPGVRPQVRGLRVGNQGEQLCPNPEQGVGTFKEPQQSARPDASLLRDVA
jgi:hypothetical protein